MRVVELPDEPILILRHLLVDLNGTLTNRGELIEGVAPRLRVIARDLEVHLLTADTFGTAEEIAAELGVAVRRVRSGTDKAEVAGELGEEGVVAIGNGRNDVALMRAARLAIAVIGPEGTAAAALVAADVVCGSITDALDLLIDERLLRATLRK